MSRQSLWVLAALLLAMFGLGCGGAMGASPAKAESAASPGAPMGGAATAEEADSETVALYAQQPPADEAPTRDSGGDKVAQGAPPPQAPAPGPMPAQKPDVKSPEEPPAPTIDTGSDKKLAGPLLIYTANVHMAVFEAKKAIDDAEKITKELGGYLVRRDDLSITVRVPAGKFDGALARMLKLGDVLHRDVSVKDVTAEFFDLQIRLKNAEAVRDRLQELLKKATNVSDAIQVERELARVTGEIESMKGRLKLLRELVMFSTITLRFEARPVDRIQSKVRLPFPWLDQLGLSNLLRL